MAHPNSSPHSDSQRGYVSRRRLIEAGAAVLGGLVLSGAPPVAHAFGAAAGIPAERRRVERPHRCLPARHRAPTRHAHAVREPQAGSHRRPHHLPLASEPRRDVEVRVRGPARRQEGGLLPHRSRRLRLGGHPGPLGLAAARPRPPDLRQHHLPVVGPQRPRRGCPASGRADPVQPRRPVPALLHRAQGLGGPAHVPALRGSQGRPLRVDQRPPDRLPRGLVHPGRVRHHPVPEGRHQPDRRRGLPLLRRRLAPGPGHDPAQRHLPVGVSVLDARRPCAGLQARHPARGRVHHRRTVGHRPRTGLHGQRGHRRPHGRDTAVRLRRARGVVASAGPARRAGEAAR